MQVFKTFFKVVWSRKAQLFLYVGIFLALSFGMANIGSGERQESFQAQSYEVAVFDYDKSSESQAFVDYIGTKTKLTECENDAEVLADQLFIQNIYAVIYIKEGYGASLKKGETECLFDVTTVPGNRYNQTITGYIDRYMSTAGAYLSTGMSVDEALERTGKVLDETPKVTMQGENVNSSHSRVYYFFLYLPYIFVTCALQIVGISIHAFRRKEIYERMRISAYSSKRENLELWGAAAVCCLGMAVLFMLASCVAYPKQMLGMDRLLMFVNLLVCVLWTFGLTYLISVTLKKESAFAMAGTVFGLAIAFLGGLFVPMEVMGKGIRRLSHMVPAYWYVKVLDIADAGAARAQADGLLGGFIMQLGFAVAFLLAGLAVAGKKRGNA